MRIFVLIFLFTSISYAGDKGNGGLSIVCRNGSNQITSAELLDIYEGRILSGRTYLPEDSILLHLNAAVERISTIRGFSKLFKEKMNVVQLNMYFIPHGNELLPTEDANPIVTKTGCKLEQLANFTEESDIYISIEIFEQLDNLNKAALFLHEAIYAARRDMGDKNSLKARKVVAEILASNYRPEVLARFVRPVKLKPGLYVSERKGCNLLIADYGWSFQYQALNENQVCPKKIFELELTGTPNLLKVENEETYFNFISEGNFIESDSREKALNKDGKLFQFKK